ncbi:MAG: hypothetical protein ACOYL6_18825 [Bacteriovoracaceae bacterium]
MIYTWIVTCIFILFSMGSYAQESSLKNSLKMLEQFNKTNFSQLTSAYTCLGQTGVEEFKSKFCQDQTLIDAHPFGLLRLAFDEQVKVHRDRLNDKSKRTTLDQKFLDWVDSQLALCREEKNKEKFIPIGQTAPNPYFNDRYSIDPNNLPPFDGKSLTKEQATFLANNQWFPMTSNFFGERTFNSELTGPNLILIPTVNLKNENLTQYVIRAGELARAIRNLISKEKPELITYEVIDMYANSLNGGSDIKIDEYISNNGKEIDRDLVAEKALNAKDDMLFFMQMEKNLSNAKTEDQFLIDSNGKRLRESAPTMLDQMEKQTEQEIKQPEQNYLKVKWKDHKIESWSVEKNKIDTPVDYHELMNKLNISKKDQERFDQIRTMVINNAANKEKLVAEMILNNQMKSFIASQYFEYNQLEDGVRGKIKAQQDEVDKFLKQSGKPNLDWNNCDDRKEMLLNRYANHLAVDENNKNAETQFNESKEFAMDRIQQMNISEKGKSLMLARLDKVQLMNQPSETAPKVMETALDEHKRLLQELNQSNQENAAWNEKSAAQEVAIWKVFDGLNFSQGEVNASYMHDKHAININAPFLSPYAQNELKLETTFVIGHEFGHALDESLDCKLCEEFSLPEEDKAKFKQVEDCLGKNHYNEDLADIFGNEILGSFMSKNAKSISETQKANFLGGMLSTICDPSYFVFDPHSSSGDRGKRTLSSPQIQKQFSSQFVMPSDPTIKDCGGILWPR